MFQDWCEETTTTTGTGDLTLTAVAGLPRIADGIPVGEPCSYAILDSARLPLESGIGVSAASNTLQRLFVRRTYSGGTFTTANATALSLAAGTKYVIATPIAGTFAATLPANRSDAAQRALFSPHHEISAGDTRTLGAANQMHYMPYLWNVGCDVEGLRCNVTTGAAGNLRMGVYTVGTDGKPLTKIIETGDVDCTSTGVKTGTFTRRFLSPGWYYVAIASKGVAASVRTFTAGGSTNIMQPTPLGFLDYDYPYAFAVETLSGGWTALPSTAAVSGYLGVNSDYAPRIGLVPS